MTQPLSRLPLPADAIVTTVRRFDQATTSQLRRLHYQGTDRGAKTRSSHHLKRLTELGKLRRMWCVYTGEKEYCYFMPGTTAKPYGHALDITELYVRFAEVLGLGVAFTPEGWLDTRVGRATLTPDAFLDLGKRQFFIEMDEGSERPARLKEKMRRYHTVWSEHWDTSTVFPPVIWVVHTPARQKDLKMIIRNQSEPRLFTCVLFSEVVAQLT